MLNQLFDYSVNYLGKIRPYQFSRSPKISFFSAGVVLMFVLPIPGAFLSEFTVGYKMEPLSLGVMLVSEDCGPLPNSENGRVDTSGGTVVGSRATYACNIGYQLSGDASRTCDSDGIWNGSQPECRG